MILHYKQKRQASPLSANNQRRPRINPDEDAAPSNSSANDQTTPATVNQTDTDAKTQNSAIHNQFFPTFKLLRKLNNKLITAQHHKSFLLGLRENGQCPKGLQVKSAPTGAELDLELYHRWEEAHITLSNTLRDILIEHWINTEAKLLNLITIHTERLEIAAPKEQHELILDLVNKANEAKASELASRRRKKQESARKTGTSGGGQAPPQPPPADRNVL